MANLNRIRAAGLALATWWLLGGNLFGAGAAGAQIPRLWPLPLPHRHLTSNFMEYRPGRLHAGLDLRTEGRTGYPVRAAEAGHIARVRVSAGGYGKAVYLAGRSGYTFVYAHLERLPDALRERVRRVQAERRAYTVDLYLAEDEFPVARGAILGLSGQSGTAGPHLHFEVRDGTQRPLNPLEFFAVRDTIPPRILGLRAIPAPVAGARVAGRVDPHAVAADGGLSGELPELTITGPVAFTARIVDHADPLAYRLEPYRLRVWLDGDEVFALRNDGFAFRDQTLMRFEWAETGELREHWLHRRAQDGLPGRSGSPWYRGARGDGLEPGEHRLRLRAEDYAGNASEVTWRVRVSAQPRAEDDEGWENGRVFPPDIPGLGADPGDEPSPADGGVTSGWRPDLVGQEVALAGAPRLVLAPLGRWYLAEPEPAAPLTLAPAPRPLPESVIETWQRDGELLGPATLYAVDLAEAAALGSGTSAAAQGLVPVGPTAGYAAWEWPARRAPWVALAAAAATPAALASARNVVEARVEPDLGVYRRNETRGVWDYVGRPRLLREPSGAGPTDAADVAEGREHWFFPLVEPGVHALMRDVMPPAVEGWGGTRLVGPGPDRMGSREVSPPRWEILTLGVADAGAGIDAASIQAWLDGERLIVEPDLPRSRILVELPDKTPAGEHTLGLEVSDRAANFTTRTFALICR